MLIYDESNPMSLIEQWLLIGVNEPVTMEWFRDRIIEDALNHMNHNLIIESIKTELKNG